MKIKKAALKLVSAAGMLSAKKAYESASLVDCYQPKEPQELKKLKK